MIWFLIYLVVGWPLYTWLFVHMERKNIDVTIDRFMSMLLVSAFPLLREIIAFSYIAEKNNVIFKKFD